MLRLELAVQEVWRRTRQEIYGVYGVRWRQTIG